MPVLEASFNGRAKTFTVSYIQKITDLEFPDEIGIQGYFYFVGLASRTAKVFGEPRLPSGGQA